jgi:hypothetical protein
VQEHEKYAKRTDIAYTEYEEGEETSAESAMISQLVVQNMFWDIPTQEQACKEAAHRQEYLARGEVE